MTKKSSASGRPFGPYVLLKSLGVGGMGEVWLAEEPAQGDRLLVVKLLRGHLVADREYVARFLDEARLVVLLEHPNLCRVFDSGRIDGRYYLAMEFVSGWDARTLVERSKELGDPLPEDLALFIGVGVLDALHYAHEKKSPETGAPLHLVHRDVSPQNVMIGFEGEVKLIDFGLAASTVKREVTRPEVVMGKLQYMSPEHARGDRVDATADQFSAAQLIYELVTGEGYYGNMSQHEIWHVAGVGGFVPPSWNTLEPRMAEVMKKALAAKPENRWASCGAFKDALIKTMHARKMRPTTDDLSRWLKDLCVVYLGGEAERLGEVPADLHFVARAATGAPAGNDAAFMAQETIAEPLDASKTLPLQPARVETSATTRIEVFDARRTSARLSKPHVVKDRSPIAAFVVGALVTAGLVLGALWWFLSTR